MKLKISGLNVGYDGGAVLKDLNLEVGEGEFLSLLGPSGCGKSTLLKAIAGIIPVKSGSICLGDRELTGCPVHKRGTVVVFQDMRLFPHMTVAENVAFPLRMQGVSRARRLRTAEELLKKVQMEGLGHRLPGALSGGQQQRVALARALAAKPELLLLDEPFSALDENLREDMRTLVLSLHREFGITVILVTHDREEALSMSDRVALMFEGRIAQIGTPWEVYNRPECRRVADYFGDCVYLPGYVKNGQFSGSHIHCPAAVPDGGYEMMLRPDDLILDESGRYPLTVEAVSFRGSDTRVIFRAEDGTVWKKSCPQAITWRPGDRCSASIQASDILFPLDGNGKISQLEITGNE